jgi:hypothetical protein
LVYALLVGKSSADYDQFFNRLMEEDDFNPASILSDFEAATVKSIKTIFPNAVHKGNSINFAIILIKLSVN